MRYRTRRWIDAGLLGLAGLVAGGVTAGAAAAGDSEVAAVHVVPAEVPKTVYEQALDASLAAHRALGCRGVSRSDFRYDDSDAAESSLYYLETNTQPGMTANSLVPEQARHIGLTFPKLCAWMVENAACDS